MRKATGLKFNRGLYYLFSHLRVKSAESTGLPKAYCFLVNRFYFGGTKKGQASLEYFILAGVIATLVVAAFVDGGFLSQVRTAATTLHLTAHDAIVR